MPQPWAAGCKPARTATEGIRDIEVHLENSGKACALSQVWATRGRRRVRSTTWFLSRFGRPRGWGGGQRRVDARPGQYGGESACAAGIDGALCSCGATAAGKVCFEPGDPLALFWAESVAASAAGDRDGDFTIEDLITRARGNDSRALTALHSTARYLGLGLASIINAVDPGGFI